MTLRQDAHGHLRRRVLFISSIVLLLLAGGLAACKSESPPGPDIRVESVWSRPAIAMGEMSGNTGSEGATMGPAMTGTGAVFMELMNNGREADRLVSAQTDVAEVVEIHETTMQGDVMKMQMLPQGLEIPAEGEVVLKPGSFHIMLIGLKRDLNEGDRISLLLEFEKSDPMTIDAEVREP